MSTPNLHVGDWGTVFRLTIRDQDDAIVDISAATAKSIIFRRPDGTAFSKAAAFVTDGTDGLLSYTVADGDLNQAGDWSYKGEVERTGAYHYETSSSSFHVKKRFT